MASMTLPTNGRSVVLPQGAQRPRICHVPEYVTSAGPEAIALARLAGLEPDDWQQFVTTGALGERADGKWAAQTVGLTVARQNGKGSVLEIRELVGLFLLGERLINHTAHQQKTATNHFRRLLELIEGVPEFSKRVKSAPRGKGNEAIELYGGQVIYFATRSGGGGRGLTADLQVYDEAMFLTEQDRSSLAPTMAARSMTGNTQTWYVGSAVDQEDTAQDGVPFAQVRESGIAKARGVAYFEWSAPGDNPADVPPEDAANPEIQALGNPGLGIRISHEWVDHERRVEMSPRSFAVERLGIGDWPATDGSANRVISDEAWAALTDAASVAEGVVCFAYDVKPDRSMAAIAVAGVRPDGLRHVEIIEYKAGTGWVAPRMAALVAAHKSVGVICDAHGPAGALIVDLTNLGVKVETVTANEHAQACGGFFDAVEQASFRHQGTQELLLAVRGAVKRLLGDSWAWSRKSSKVDICPLVAATLAHWGLREIKPRPKPRFEVIA